LTQGAAIPEYELIDGVEHYFLDLSIIRSEIGGGGGGAFATALNITSNSPGDFDLDSFVFGSPSLDEPVDANHYNRIIFDKNKAAFRAGRATGAQWDNANRGSHSAAFGRDNTVGAARSTIAGGDANTIFLTGTESGIVAGSSNSASGVGNFIGAGTGNAIAATTPGSAIIAGQNNTVEATTNFAIIGSGNANTVETGANRSGIFSGNTNTIETSALDGFIGAGSTNRIRTSSSYSGILSGNTNTIGDGTAAAQYAAIVGGNSNIVYSNYSIIGGGDNNQVVPTDGVDAPVTTTYTGIFGGRDGLILGARYAVIAGGFDNSVQKTATDVASDYSSILGGSENAVTGTYCAIGGGQNNQISEVGGSTPTHTSIWGGQNHQTVSSHTVLVGGQNNTISSASSHSSIMGGASHVVESDYSTIIAGVQGIINTSSIGSAIIGGMNNEITSSLTSVMFGGNTNSITNSNYSTVLNGSAHVITGAPYSTIVGGKYGEATHSGSVVFPTASGTDVPPGTHQTFRVHWVGITTNAAYTEIFIDRSSERLVIPDDTSYHFDIRICGRTYDPALKVSDYHVQGVITRDTGAATVNLVAGGTVTTVHEDDTDYDARLTADVANGSLKIEVRGDTGDSVVWMASGVIYRLTAEAGVGGGIDSGDIIIIPDPEDPIDPEEPDGPGWRIPPDRESVPPIFRPGDIVPQL
jgi:hypothetical protein